MRRRGQAEPASTWFRIMMWRMALGSALLSAMPGMAVDTAYSIDECAMPLALELHGVPSVAGIPLETTLEICRGQGAFEMQMQDPTDSARWLAEHARAPSIDWVRHDGTLDVRVELRDEPVARVYEGKRIAPGAKETVLARVDHDGGPRLGVSLRRMDAPSMVSIHVVDARASDVLRDLMRIKHLTVRHGERISDRPITFKLQMVKVETLLELLADFSGVVLHREGSGRFLFGLNPHAAEIAALHQKADGLAIDNDTAGVKRALQRIVELSASTAEGEPGVPVGEALGRLAAIAMDEDDAAGAERFLRTYLLELERAERGTESPDHALVLADLARARLAQDDRGAALSMLERALSILSKNDRDNSLARARVLGDLGELAIESASLEAAARHADQAWAIVQGTDAEVAERQALPWLRARLVLDRLEGRLGEAFMERKQYLKAERHFERAVALSEALWGVDDRLAFSPRQQFTMNAWLMGKPGRAAKMHLARVSAADAAGDVRSFALANALGHLAAIRAGEGDMQASVAFGTRYLDVVASATGAASPRADSARRFLALLYRLDRRFDMAEGVEGRKQAPAAKPVSAPVPASARIDEAAIFDTSLALQLANHFDRELQALATASSKDEARRAYLQENAAEAYASAGIELMATDRWHEALATLNRLKGPRDAQTQRVARRLTAIHERNGSAMGLDRVRRELLQR